MADQINEELKKCGACKKTVKKAKKYYRNGKYYCGPNCWRKAKVKLKAEAAEAAEAAAGAAEE